MNSKAFDCSRRRIVRCALTLGFIATAGTIGAVVLRPQPTPRTKQITSSAAIATRAHRSGKTHFDLLAKYIADDRRGRDESGVIRAVSDSTSELRVGSQQHPLLDRPAPLFALQDSDGQSWSLGDKLESGPVVLVFYLSYGCDACVSGLFELNADLSLFQSLGAEVVAISDDPVDLTQRRFKRYGRFSFPVLTDPEHVVAAMYSTFRPRVECEPEQLLHATFVIGQDGNVKWAQTGDTPFTLFTAVLCELAQFDPKRLQTPDARVPFRRRDDE